MVAQGTVGSVWVAGDLGTGCSGTGTGTGGIPRKGGGLWEFSQALGLFSPGESGMFDEGSTAPLTKGSAACHTLTCWAERSRGITKLSSQSISMRKGALLVFWHVTARWQGAQIQSGTLNTASHCRLWQCWAPRLSLLWHSPSFPLPTLPFATAARPPLLFLHNVSIITCQASAYRPGMVNKRLLCLKNVASFTINLVLQMHTIGAIDTEANTHINM